MLERKKPHVGRDVNNVRALALHSRVARAQPPLSARRAPRRRRVTLRVLDDGVVLGLAPVGQQRVGRVRRRHRLRKQRAALAVGPDGGVAEPWVDLDDAVALAVGGGARHHHRRPRVDRNCIVRRGALRAYRGIKPVPNGRGHLRPVN
eukprot:6172025-Pleurochrysis_carterae.AAC.6